MGGWLTHGDMVLEAHVDFLAVVEHRLVPARVRGEWAHAKRAVVDMSLHGDHGAAWRRRQRRLRSWWRHEQQTVAAVLATFQHHSAPRGPRTARTGGERETNYTATLRKMLPSPGGWCPALCDGRRGGRWRGTSRRAASTVAEGAAAGTGSAAHRGADRRPCAFGPVAPRRCAADGRTAGGLSHTSRLLVRDLAWLGRGKHEGDGNFGK